jgi:hypothetical protein
MKTVTGVPRWQCPGLHSAVGETEAGRRRLDPTAATGAGASPRRPHLRPQAAPGPLPELRLQQWQPGSAGSLGADLEAEATLPQQFLATSPGHTELLCAVQSPQPDGLGVAEHRAHRGVSSAPSAEQTRVPTPPGQIAFLVRMRGAERPPFRTPPAPSPGRERRLLRLRRRQRACAQAQRLRPAWLSWERGCRPGGGGGGRRQSEMLLRCHRRGGLGVPAFRGGGGGSP